MAVLDGSKIFEPGDRGSLEHYETEATNLVLLTCRVSSLVFIFLASSLTAFVFRFCAELL